MRAIQWISLLFLLYRRAITEYLLARRQRLRQAKAELILCYLETFDPADRLRPTFQFLSRAWFADSLLRMEDHHFRPRMRMYRSSFFKLARLLNIDEEPRGPGLPPLTAEHQLAIFLDRCANAATCASTGDKYGVSASSVHRVTMRVAAATPRALANCLAFPTLTEFREQVVPGFNDISDIPNIGLVLDGTYIVLQRAPPFTEDPRVYINHKLRHAIHMQAAVDWQRLFRDVCIGWPGSVHDQRVYELSQLGQHAAERMPRG